MPSSSKSSIVVTGLSKKYRIGAVAKHTTLRDKLDDSLRHPLGIGKDRSFKDFWALKQVSFEVKQGEVIGIIGRNGSGKSTLLKILSRIVDPTEGEALMHGRVASLLEVGTGFNAELTGRENIFLNGAILGMSRKEIATKMEAIIDFSGIHEFIDTPVKRYSSGMYVRLAFAVAAHLDSDILLVDEVLAVGDIDFQRKSLGKMKDLAGDGRTVLFVSHNMSAVSRLCDKGIVLADGAIAFEGKVEEAIKKYSELNMDQDVKVASAFDGNMTDIFEKVSFKISPNSESIDPRKEVSLIVEYSSKETRDNFVLNLALYKEGVRIFTLCDSKPGKAINIGENISTFTLQSHILRPGNYTVGIGGYIEGTDQWFFCDSFSTIYVDELWDDKNDPVLVGLINIEVKTKRE